MEDIHINNVMSHGNLQAARRMCAIFSSFQVKTFINIHARLCGTGSLKKTTGIPRKPTRDQTVDSEVLR